MLEGYSLALCGWEEARSEVDLAILVQTYAGPMFRVAHSVLRSRADAEDVVQDAFMRVLQHQRTLPEVRDMRVWLVRIVWNLALDRQRRVRPEQMDAAFGGSLVAANVPVDRALSEAQNLAIVLVELERLPKAERHVLLLSATDAMSTAEIASVLRKSESAVRALLFRARSRLRARVAEKTGGRR